MEGRDLILQLQAEMGGPGNLTMYFAGELAQLEKKLAKRSRQREGGKGVRSINATCCILAPRRRCVSCFSVDALWFVLQAKKRRQHRLISVVMLRRVRCRRGLPTMWSNLMTSSSALESNVRQWRLAQTFRLV